MNDDASESQGETKEKNKDVASAGENKATKEMILEMLKR